MASGAMSDPLDVLDAAEAKTRRGMGCVGVGTLLLGGFMVALHLAELDPEMADAGTGMLVALYLFAGLFLLVGALLLKVAIVGPGQATKIREHADQITAVQPFVIKTKGFENAPGGQHGVKVTFADGTMVQLNLGEADVGPIVAHIEQLRQG